MGSGRWSDSDWSSYATSTGVASKTVDKIFASSGLDSDLDPRNIKMRESCDSKDNPNSTPLIVALDVTGSMGRVLDQMAKHGLNTLCTEVYNRKPITDPHVMCLGIGDVEFDRAPLQATQFEADIRIAKQLEKLYLERGGGGNEYESYALAWYFAATKTKIDSFKKRKKKGYLFTVGDEGPTPYLRAQDIARIMGSAPEKDLDAKALLTMVSRQWEVFHLVVEDGSYDDRFLPEWQDLLGQRAIRLADHTKMAEVIVSVMEVNEGANAKKVAGSWDGSTSIVVGKAVASLGEMAKQEHGIVTL